MNILTEEEYRQIKIPCSGKDCLNLSSSATGKWKEIVQLSIYTVFLLVLICLLSIKISVWLARMFPFVVVVCCVCVYLFIFN